MRDEMGVMGRSLPVWIVVHPDDPLVLPLLLLPLLPPDHAVGVLLQLLLVVLVVVPVDDDFDHEVDVEDDKYDVDDDEDVHEDSFWF